MIYFVLSVDSDIMLLDFQIADVIDIESGYRVLCFAHVGLVCTAVQFQCVF